MMSADDVVMTSPRADVNRGTLARAGAWQHVTARDGAWAILAALESACQ